MVMSDRIGIMREGKLVQVGSPHEIYNNPVNEFVAQFMGEINSIGVKRTGPTTVVDNHGRTFSTDTFPDEFETGILIIRPEVMKISKVGVDLDNKIDAQLYNDYPLGSRIQFQALTQETGEHWLVERLQDDILDIQLGGAVVIGWSSKDAILVQD
jgi:spermidine/putrescine transport system ATP-binding protein